MQHDPLYQYILLNIPRRRRDTMMPPFMPLEFTQDPLNLHYDNRRTWLAWRAPEPPRPPARQRLGRLLVRLGRWVEGHRPTPPPPFDTAPTRRPATLETAP
jgi:hypothetical protein